MHEKAKKKLVGVVVAIKELKFESGEAIPAEKILKLGAVLRKGIAEGKTVRQMASEMGCSKSYLNKVLTWTKRYSGQ